MNGKYVRTRAQESSNAIERLYITMRHLFNRGFYKPTGVSGESIRQALLNLRPEIYGSIAEEKVEIEGLSYVLDRLPEGIEQCRFINLTSSEGFAKSHFKVIIPPKRRRNCYRVDDEQMNIEITRGRSDIYDVLTHLTFLYNESLKIKNRVLLDINTGKTKREWEKFEKAIALNKTLTVSEREIALTHAATFLARSFEEVLQVYSTFKTKANPDRFLQIVYWLGTLAIEEAVQGSKRAITFSPVLREQIGHHIHGELWATNIKEVLDKNGLLERPIHIISANMHSVMNSIYTPIVFEKELKKGKDIMELFSDLSKSENKTIRKKIINFSNKNGLIYIEDKSGTNINVQLIDTAKVDFNKTNYNLNIPDKEKPVLFVMDYAFGEQAYETLDEFLKPYTKGDTKTYLNVVSISIMGKAGILEGNKGDIMIPNAHMFEGTADNYVFDNQLKKEHLEGYGIGVYDGTMLTVLGTSLQNKDMLEYFQKSSWHVMGLEMEGAHYQKAIQAASQIRKNIRKDVKVSYAYYASDNPLKTGATLASGGLGETGVKPTYLITRKILEQIFN
jgi:hypothetical protein